MFLSTSNKDAVLARGLDKSSSSRRVRHERQRQRSFPPQGMRRRRSRLSENLTNTHGWSSRHEVDDNGRAEQEEDLALFYGSPRAIFHPKLINEANMILTRSLMQALRPFLPYTKRFENFWLKYSLVRDGAFLRTLLKKVRTSTYTLLAIETVDGEVFGSFTASPWRLDWRYYGSGESFLWRLQRPASYTSFDYQEETTSALRTGRPRVDVYPATGVNDYIQLCQSNRILVGGGRPPLYWDTTATDHALDEETPDDDHSLGVEIVAAHEWGAGICILGDLLQGTSSPCATFNSPSLSQAHSDGSLFEIANLEVWSFTPCIGIEQAEKMEMHKLFIQEHSRRSLG